MLYRVIGLMSGSSLDGLDLTFVEFEEKGGKWSFTIIASACYPYDEQWTNRLRTGSELKAVDYVLLDAEYGHYLGEQINRFIQEKALEYKVGLIASHGHTLFHLPGKYSVQIGNGAAIAADTSLPVVSDLRSLDVALGGQGAPIVPMGEQLLFPEYTFFLNIGGISNISFKGEQVYDAFDVCPANRVLNQLAEQKHVSFDKDGAFAAAGRISESLLERLNQQAYYQSDYPKSLANEFGTEVVYPMLVASELPIEDLLATYTEHIAIQVALAIEKIMAKRSLPNGQHKMLVTGGGAYNAYLISRISQHLLPYGIELVLPSNEIIEYKEALIMALLGVLRWREEETVFSSVTGAKRASTGGAFWMGQD
jgi:anhydro-N-acetylmuramic acid kinase